MKRFLVSLVVFAMLATPLYAATRSVYNRNGSMLFYDDVTGQTLGVLAPNVFEDNFSGDTLDTNLWLATIDTGGTAVISSASGYTLMTLTTDATDNDKIEVATELSWLATSQVSVEARIRINDVSNHGMFFGLTDARFEAAQTLPFSYSGTTLTSTASNAVAFLNDPDQTVDTVKCVSVKANVDGTVNSTGTALVDAAWHIYRIDLDTSGNAKLFIDGAHVCTQSLALTTTTPLAAVVGVQNRTTSAENSDVDYVKVWSR